MYSREQVGGSMETEIKMISCLFVFMTLGLVETKACAGIVGTECACPVWTDSSFEL